MCRPLAPIVMPEMEKSEYELVRLANIEEKEAEFLRIKSSTGILLGWQF